jgi:hypothetical protein
MCLHHRKNTVVIAGFENANAAGWTNIAQASSAMSVNGSTSMLEQLRMEISALKQRVETLEGFKSGMDNATRLEQERAAESLLLRNAYLDRKQTRSKIYD